MSTRDQPNLSDQELQALARLAEQAQQDDPGWFSRLRDGRPAGTRTRIVVGRAAVSRAAAMSAGGDLPAQRPPAALVLSVRAGAAIGLCGLLAVIVALAIAPLPGWPVLGSFGLLALTAGVACLAGCAGRRGPAGVLSDPEHRLRSS